MTCKDNCLHYEVCQDFKRNICIVCNYRHKEFKINRDGLCDYFKNKSKYIELPCKVGGEVFVSPNGKDFYKAKLYGKNEKGAYFVEVYSTLVGIPLDNPFYDWHFNIYTKSEAEAKLKELNENG